MHREWIDLAEAAIQLGVHYQTAYKWVRSGELKAESINGAYRLDPEVVARFAERRKRPAPRRVRQPRDGFAPISMKLHDLLVVGDDRECRHLVEHLVADGVSMVTFIDDVLAPAMRLIGSEWALGQVTIATEHRATVIAAGLLAANGPVPRGRKRGVVAVAALAGDHHSLATSMAAVALREENWRVHNLGADVPADELATFCNSNRIELVVITVTNTEQTTSASEVAASLSIGETRVIVGGSGRTVRELVAEARND